MSKESSQTFLERITDKPNSLAPSPAFYDVSVLPLSPAASSPTLASALSSSVTTTSTGHETTTSSNVSSPFPFPDLLPPSSELPLIDVDFGDLTVFNSEVPSLGEDWRNSSLQADPLSKLEGLEGIEEQGDTRLNNKDNGLFSSLLEEDGSSSAFKVNGTTLQRAPDQPVTRNSTTTSPNYNNPFVNHQGRIIHRPLYQTIPIPRTQPGITTYQPPRVLSHSINLRGDSTEERIFKCAYPNCGKVYAKSSHLKVKSSEIYSEYNNSY